MSSWVGRLKAAEGNNAAFDQVLSELKADRRVTGEALHAIVCGYVGWQVKRRTKSKYLNQIEDHQALEARQRARGAR